MRQSRESAAQKLRITTRLRPQSGSDHGTVPLVPVWCVATVFLLSDAPFSTEPHVVGQASIITFYSEATRRIRIRVHRPCLPPKIHPEPRVACNPLLLILSSVMNRCMDRGLDMPKCSGLAAQTKVDVAARPILDERTFPPQGPLFVKDENRMIPRSLHTYNPQVDMEVSVLVGSLLTPQLI